MDELHQDIKEIKADVKEIRSHVFNISVEHAKHGERLKTLESKMKTVFTVMSTFLISILYSLWNTFKHKIGLQ